MSLIPWLLSPCHAKPNQFHILGQRICCRICPILASPPEENLPLITNELLHAYLASHYGTGEVTFRIGEQCNVLAQRLTPVAPLGAVLITAWNPRSQWQDQASNDQANQRLRQDMLQRRLTVCDGFGASPDGRWREDGFLAYPLDRPTAQALGEHYQQNAVVFIQPDGLVELVLCTGKHAKLIGLAACITDTVRAFTN